MIEIDACDPGLTGAFAVYGSRGLVDVTEMPTYEAKAGVLNRERTFLDEARILAYLQGRTMCGASHLIIEQVGGIPGQAAHGAFNFGHGAGLIKGIALALGMVVELVPAVRWKAAMKCPADKDLATQRATDLMPNDAWRWRIARNVRTKAQANGNAEAAMIAYYGWQTRGQL